MILPTPPPTHTVVARCLVRCAECDGDGLLFAPHARRRRGVPVTGRDEL